MMSRFAGSLVQFLKSEEGPTAVEYAVMLALIIVVCILSITLLGTNSNGTYQKVGTNLKSASS
jgi:pilus assembly protein Flp/PilA